MCFRESTGRSRYLHSTETLMNLSDLWLVEGVRTTSRHRECAGPHWIPLFIKYNKITKDYDFEVFVLLRSKSSERELVKIARTLNVLDPLSFLVLLKIPFIYSYFLTLSITLSLTPVSFKFLIIIKKVKFVS